MKCELCGKRHVYNNCSICGQCVCTECRTFKHHSYSFPICKPCWNACPTHLWKQLHEEVARHENRVEKIKDAWGDESRRAVK